MTSADLDEVPEDELDEDDEDEQEEAERARHTRRWVRYVMPVMVEVDCDTDEITSVTLPGEVRLDRDDTMDLCIYDEKFRRRPLDGQAQAHALSVSEPRWQYPGLIAGRPVNWPGEIWHEDYFPRDADEDAYAEAHPYADGDQDDY